MVTRGQRGGRDQQGSPGDFAVMDTRPSTLIHTHRIHKSKHETNKTHRLVRSRSGGRGHRTACARALLYTLN